MLIKKGKCSKCGLCCERCEQLAPNGECKIHDSKPRECRTYPVNPMQLEEECSYWFEEDGVKITFKNKYDFPQETRDRWQQAYMEKSEDE